MYEEMKEKLMIVNFNLNQQMIEDSQVHDYPITGDLLLSLLKSKKKKKKKKRECESSFLNQASKDVPENKTRKYLDWWDGCPSCLTALF